MNLKIDLNSIHMFTANNFFVDANIWIYLYCPISDSKKEIVEKYSKALSILIKSNSKIYIDVVVLSEFINRYEQIAFRIYKQGHGKNEDFNFKRDYKNTDDYKEIVKLIASQIKNKILKISNIINFSYDNNNIEELINDYESNYINFRIRFY